MKKKTIIITGISGQDGSFLAEKLCKEYKMCEDKAAWATFLRVVVMIREYDTLDSVVDAWEVFIAAWRAKTKHDAMIDVPHPVYPT